MSQEEQSKPGEMVLAGSGVPAHRPKGDLPSRILTDLQSSRPVPAPQSQPAELDSSCRWRCRATLLHPHVSCLAVGLEGSLMASGGFDGTVRLWRLPECSLVGTLDLNQA
jgi:hypothetical protein